MIESNYTENISGDVNKTVVVDDIQSLLTFKIAGLSCCVNLKDITAVIDTKELGQNQNIDSDDPHIVSGSIKIPLVDVYKMNGLPSRKRDENERLLVVEIDSKLMGFLVEKVDSVYYVDRGMRNKIKFTECKNILHLNGLVNFENETFFLLDLKDLITKRLND